MATKIIALNYINLNLSVEAISELIGLPVAEVERLLKDVD